MSSFLASVVFPFVSLSVSSPDASPPEAVPVEVAPALSPKAKSDIAGLMRAEKEMLLVSGSQAVAVYVVPVRWREIQTDVLNVRIREALKALNKGEFGGFRVAGITTSIGDGNNILVFTVLYEK